MNYWNQTQENTIIEFNECKDQNKRSLLYNCYLKEPINKLSNSILKRYFNNNLPLLSKYEQSAMLQDVQSHIVSKLDRYDPNKNTTSGSFGYVSAVCKYWMISYFINAENELKRLVDVDTLGESDQRFLTEQDVPVEVFKGAHLDAVDYLRSKLKDCDHDHEIEILRALILFMSVETDERRFTRFYPSLWLHKMTSLPYSTIAIALKRLGIDIVKFSHQRIIEKAFKEYEKLEKRPNEESKSKIVSDWEIEAIQHYNTKKGKERLNS